MNSQSQPSPLPASSTVSIVIRGTLGGTLMGLANLVPGISGGTMLVAAGIYTRFIDAIAEVTTFRFRRESIFTLACVCGAAALAIVLLAGLVKTLVVDHRWIMYSIFIGLTLGGVPVIWKMIGKATAGVWIGLVLGLAGMSVLAWVQMRGMGESGIADAGFALMLFAGIAGASAMILPGVSGGYLLLVLGVYVPILAGIDQFKIALKSMDMAALMLPMGQVIVPVGLGVLIGVILVSNLLRLLLKRFEKPTLGVLMGLLFGAVVGLYPFQQGIAPEEDALFKGDTVVWVDGQPTLKNTGKFIEPEKYPTAFFRPAAAQIGGSLALIFAGFVTTAVIARLSEEKPKHKKR